MGLTRRHLLRSAFAGGAVIGGAALVVACDIASTPSPSPRRTSVLGPPETTTIRVNQTAVCDPWSWMCEPYLRDEGFTNAQTWVDKDPDLFTNYVHNHLTSIDVGDDAIALAPMHTGCVQVWTRPTIATVTDLRGKTIAVGAKTNTFKGVTSPDLFYGFWVSLFAHVGMQTDDATFIETRDAGGQTNAFLSGKADAVMTVAAQGPIVQKDPRNTGRLLLDANVDKPWSQQVCCVLAADGAWVKANPIAAKRATRAILRAVDDANRDQAVSAAKAAVQKGLDKYFAPGITEQLIIDVNKHLHFDWRDLDPEDTYRFYGLRLRDGKLIKKAPQQLIAEGTDFAFFKQMQKELKP